jgi:hypothetical protein
MITRRLLQTNSPERERLARRGSESQALTLADIRIQLFPSTQELIGEELAAFLRWGGLPELYDRLAGLHALLQKAEELDEYELILVFVRKTLSDLIENIAPRPDEDNMARRCPLLWKETGTPIHPESARRKAVA